MIKIQCEKCSKIVDAAGSGQWLEIISISQTRKTKQLPPDVYHLCPKCAVEFEEYMRKAREQDVKAIKIGDDE